MNLLPTLYHNGTICKLNAFYPDVKHHTLARDPPMILKNLCSNKNPLRHLISILYSSLFGENTAFSSTSCLAWVQDLDIQNGNPFTCTPIKAPLMLQNKNVGLKYLQDGTEPPPY